MNEIRSLTGLRFVAAFYVCAYHGAHNLTPFRWLNNIHSAGYTAVSLFFVLSGFILATTSSEHFQLKNFNFRSFMVKRVARIFPIHWLCIVGYLALDGAPSFGVLVANLFCFATFFSLPIINMPAWSLCCEMFFYACFLPIVRQVSRLQYFGCVVASIVCFASSLAIAAVGFLFFPDETMAISWHPVARIPEFIVGILIVRMNQLKPVSIVTSDLRVWLSLGLILAVLASSSLIPRIFLENSLLMLPFACLVSGLAQGGGGWLQRILSSNTAVILGKASFTMYLLQSLFAESFKKLTSEFIFSGLTSALTWRVLLIAVSLVAFRFIEEPTRRWLIQKFAPTRSSDPPKKLDLVA